MAGIHTRQIPHYAQPQHPEDLDQTNPFVKRGILFAFNGATGIDGVSGKFGAAVGALSKTVGPTGKLEYYSTDNVNRSFTKSDTDWLGSLTLISRFKSGASATRLFSKAIADDSANPLRVSLDGGQNGIYVIRAGATNVWQSHKPGTAITTQSVHKTIGIVFDGNTVYVNPVFYDGKTTVNGIDAFSGSDGAVTGGNHPAVVGNWDTGGSMEVEYCYVFPYAMTDAEVHKIMDAPWQIFQPYTRKIYVTGATGSYTHTGSGGIVFAGTAPKTYYTTALWTVVTPASGVWTVVPPVTTTWS